MVKFEKICDLSLPEGEKLRGLNAFGASMQSPMEQEMVKIKLPEYLKQRYNATHLFVNNVTGVILFWRSFNCRFLWVETVGKMCTIDPIPGLPTMDMQDFPTVHHYGPNDEENPCWAYFRPGWSDGHPKSMWTWTILARWKADLLHRECYAPIKPQPIHMRIFT